jgi:hypothetical protein
MKIKEPYGQYLAVAILAAFSLWAGYTVITALIP